MSFPDPFPYGVPLPAFTTRFTPVPTDLTARPGAAVDLHARLAPFAAELVRDFVPRSRHDPTMPPAEAFRTGFDLERWLPSLEARHFRDCTPDELAKVWHGSIIMLAVSPIFHGGLETDTTHTDAAWAYPQAADPALRLIGKLANSRWRWGTQDRDWNSLVTAYDAVRRFDLGIPGLTVTLDWTRFCNEMGYATHQRSVYLDGALAFHCYRGTPGPASRVATIGFSLAAGRRVLVHQVQLAQPKGNRWLYRLGQPLLAHVLDRMVATFAPAGLTVCLVHGGDLAARIEAAYQRAAPEQRPAPETFRRIARTYGQPLASYRRSTHPVRMNGLRFHSLVPRRPLAAAG